MKGEKQEGGEANGQSKAVNREDFYGLQLASGVEERNIGIKGRKKGRKKTVAKVLHGQQFPLPD